MKNQPEMKCRYSKVSSVTKPCVELHGFGVDIVLHLSGHWHPSLLLHLRSLIERITVVGHHWGPVPLRTSAIEDQCHWGPVPLRTSAIAVQCHWGPVPLRSSGIEDQPHWGPAALRSSTIEDQCHWGPVTNEFPRLFSNEPNGSFRCMNHTHRQSTNHSAVSKAQLSYWWKCRDKGSRSQRVIKHRRERFSILSVFHIEQVWTFNCTIQPHDQGTSVFLYFVYD
jgi:hypothetical protein